jgi:hypothetical protein
MKHLLSIFAFIIIATTVHAQVNKIPKKLVAKPNWQITDRTTGQRGYSKLKIITSMTDTESKGQTLRFDSNTDIAKVEIYFLESNNVANTMSYPDGTKNGYFYIESGAYKGGLAKGYLLKFYVKGKADHVWVSAILPNK